MLSLPDIIWTESIVTKARILEDREIEKQRVTIGMWQKFENFTMPYDGDSCSISYHTWQKYADKSVRNRSSEVNKWILINRHINGLDPNSLFQSASSTFMQEMTGGILMIGWVYL